MKQAGYVSVVVCLLLLLGSTLSAQSAAATVRGTVRDGSGAVLPGVTVTIRSLETGSSSTAVTDGQGRFEISGLDAGDHEMRAELSGFGTYQELIATGLADTRTVDLELEVAPLSETVTVMRSEEDRVAIPNAVSVIEGDRIQAFQRRASPAEALAGVPGFFVENRRNFSLSGGVRLAIRAPLPRFGMRGVQIVQDDVPMTVADGTTEPTNIDLGSLGRVEILRGPSSVLYGNSAGGVLSLRTELPSSERLTVQPDIQYGSYRYRHQQLKVHGTSGRMSYLVNASRMETDGFRDHSQTEVRRVNTVIRAALSPDTELRGVFNVYDLPFGESASTLTRADARDHPTSVRPEAVTQGWGESTTQGQAGLTLEHHFGDGHRFRGTGWGLLRDVWNPIPFGVVDVRRHASGFRSEYEGSARVRSVPVRWTAGFDVSRQRDERAEFENDGVPPDGGRTRVGTRLLEQREGVLSLSPFVRASVGLGHRWHLTGGARYDHYDFSAADRFLDDGDQSGGRTLSAVSPMVGVTYTAASWLNLYSSFATAYQTPTTVELSNRPSGTGGFNEELGPERLRSFEIGARGAVVPWRLSFEAAGYVSRLEDALVRFELPDERAFFRNAARARRNGIEASVEWKPMRRLRSHVSYTFQDFALVRFVAPEGDFSGKTEPGAPPHQVSLGGSYDTPFGLHAAAELRFVDAYPVDSANTVSNWAYHVLDLRFGLARSWKGTSIRPFVTIDNVFNERYNSSAIPNSLANRFFEPAAGRELAIGVTIRAKLF
ncbi:MAG: TonB-dependent receptor [Luteitalea sp.]|nr:TonB-dependent receptor [Luteitalea sp.]